MRAYKQFARVKDVQRASHYSGFGAGFPETRRQRLELQFTERTMANPAGHVVLGEEEAQQAAERYAKMEAELQALRQRNEELMRAVQEQQDLVAAERVRADRRSRAQTQEFANLTAELLAGRQGPDVQFEGMRIGVKVEKPETYSGEKTRDLDTWLFQVREHLDITTIPARGHVPYAASLLRGNAALWWRETCEGHRRPATWDDFCRMLREQFRPEDYGRRGRDELATMRQYGKESVADFVFRFRATCLKIPDLSEAEKLDRFVRALAQDIRLQVELRGPQDFHEAAMFAERADAVITRVSGQDTRKPWQKGQKGGYMQRPPLQNKSIGETSAQGSGGPEPMELGMARRRTLTREEIQKLRAENACFYCRKPNAGHVARDCPQKKKRVGNGTGR